MIIKHVFRVLPVTLILAISVISLYGRNDLTWEILSHRITDEVGSAFFKITAKQPDQQKLVVVGVKITHGPEIKEISTGDMAIGYSTGGKEVTAPCLGGSPGTPAGEEKFWALNDPEASASYSINLGDNAQGIGYVFFVFPLPNEVNDIKLVYRGASVGKPINIVRK
jgi:hypothetical protein